jgi:hypothetical protein
MKVARKVLKWRGIREGCWKSWVVQYQHSSDILKLLILWVYYLKDIFWKLILFLVSCKKKLFRPTSRDVRRRNAFSKPHSGLSWTILARNVTACLYKAHFNIISPFMTVSKEVSSVLTLRFIRLSSIIMNWLISPNRYCYAWRDLIRASLQAVNCRPLTAEARVQSQVSLRGICDVQKDSGTGFFYA